MPKKFTGVPAEVRKKLYDNTPENVAKAAAEGMKTYDSSFKNGRSTKDLEICFILSCEKHKVDPRFSRLLYLAGISWWNDLQDWVEKRGVKC